MFAKLITKYLLYAAFALASTPLYSQSSNSNTGWFQYFGDHPFSKHWGIHAEGQWRRDGIITSWEQLLLRTGINYKVNEHLTLTAGYTYLRTFEYGEIPRQPSREHRVYEELNLTHRLGRVDWEHRFRLEQRFMAEEQDYRWTFGERVRYRLQAHVPLGAKRTAEGRFYCSLYNEIFVKFGPDGGPQAFDQNRVYSALGINLKGKNRLEMGYMFRYFPQPSGVVQQEHSLQISIFSDSRLFGRH